MGGEELEVTERLVLAPITGTFRIGGGSSGAGELRGRLLAAGTRVGEVVRRGVCEPVTTPFAGVFAGLLASEGQPVREGEPVAWLRDPG